MKKIMFNDRLGLTDAALQGTKTVTRRLISIPQKAFGGFEIIDNRPISWGVNGNEIEIKRPYKVGEIVAIAQSYKNAGYDEDTVFYRSFPEFDGYSQQSASTQRGWTNKMHVCANLMPHQIRILAVRAERLQDITDEDCSAEGVRYIEDIGKFYFARKDRGEGFYFDTPRGAFTALIDKVCGRGTWSRNPYVWRIEFELVK